MDKVSLTSDSIVQSAMKLFSEKGYLGATTKEIAREAGVSEVTLFRHFATKEKLLEEVINRYSFLPALKGLLSEVLKLPYEEALTVIAHRLHAFLVARKDWIRIVQAEVQRSSESKLQATFSGLMDELFNTLAVYFSAMQEKGELREFDPAYGARAFHGMVYSYFHMEEVLMCSGNNAADMEKVIKEFVKIFVLGTNK